MRRRTPLVLATGLVVAALAGTGLGSAATATATEPPATSGDVTRLIVTLVDDEGRQAEVTAAAASADLPVAGVEIDDTRDLGAGNVRVDLSEGVSDADAEAMIDEIEADPRVASVEIDRLVPRAVFPTNPPNDPYWADNSLWGLYGSYGVGIGSSRTSMTSTWTTGQGSGAVVAVLDSGYTAHPDLDANYVAGYDFVSAAAPDCRTGATNFDGDYVSTGTYGALGWDATPLDPGDWTTTVSGTDCVAENSSWHGTHVSGTIAAVGNNSTGVIGVAPQARVQPVRVLSYGGGFTSDIIAAITWASGGTVAGVTANATPADVINLSLGGESTCTSAWQTAITAAVDRGSVVVASAGNSTADAATSVPANCSGVITVAAGTRTGTLASYSNYGSTVEITAPGSGIWSTMNSGATTPGAATYASYDGTSMAAPHVSGVAALLVGADSSRTPAQVLSLIQTNATCFPVTGSWYDGNTSIAGAGLLRAGAIAFPNICSTAPSTGPIAGGTSVTVTGTNLASASTVTFGGTSATITAQTSTSLTVTAPARASGAADITVANPSGSGTSTGAFRYFDPPTATGLSVATGSTAGGTTVVITGTDLAPADVQDTSWISVSFGGSAATVWLPGRTSVQVTTPARAAGTVDVVVTTPGGSSTLAGAFTFVAPPPSGGGGGGGGGSSSSSSTSSGGSLQAITEVRPAFGPVSGGNLVAIIGYGFTGATSVTIGGRAASFRVVNDATVEVTMPAAAGPGSADVAVNLTPERGRAFAPGGYVYQADAPAAVAPIPSPAGPSPATTPTQSGDLVMFAAGSSVLTASARTRLARLADRVGDGTALGSVTVFSDARGTKASVAVARDRAQGIVSYLRSQGVTAKITTSVEEGSTATLRRSAVVVLSSDPEAGTVAPNERITSLIVRYAKGVSPTVDGKVRGARFVAGGLGAGMTLGPNLGLRMYRVDFAQSVTLAQAEAAADAMAKDPGVEFAEPDRLVSARATSG